MSQAHEREDDPATEIPRLRQRVAELEIQRRAQQLSERLLPEIAAGASLARILDALAGEVERALPGMLASVYVHDAAAGVLRTASAPSLPPAYRDAVAVVPVAEGCGSCGTAAWRRARVVVVELATSPLWTPHPGFLDAALAGGLKACWSQPILSARDEVLGTYALYYREPREPLPEELSLLETAAHLAGIAIERERAERRLRESEERYRHLFETTAEGIWVVDADGRTTLVNPSMAAMLGCTVAEMLGRSFLDFTDEEGRRTALRNFDRRRNGIREQHDFCLRRKDGAPLWTLMTTNPVHDAAGRFAGAMAVVTDMSARRRAEEAMLRAARLDTAATMAGGIAHDFNNLMVGVLGNAELLLMEQRPGSEAAQLLHAIAQAARRAGDLAQHLLRFARGGEFEPRTVQLNDLVADTLRLEKNLTPARIRLEADLDPELPPIAADPGQLQQVVLNLITNAVEAIPDQGGIRVETRVVGFATEQRLEGAPESFARLPAGEYVRLRVRDDGSGMAEGVRQRLFEPFFSTKGKGRGLGLAALLGIVVRHRGGVAVHSDPNRGTGFEVFLPVSRGAEHAVPLAQEPGATGEETVLAVDDEELVLQVEQRLLDRAGYRVLLARNGEEALRVAREHRAAIRLAIVDLSMPGIGGVELFTRLRETMPELAVLFSSGHDPHPSDADQIARPGTAFLRKPFDGRELVAAVRALLDATARARL
ncbi:MAG: PAS domain S-box protein [Planctomycetes bacterium]|nr:PAS domain S-box protein [Planctomycetota bacterium]